MNSFISDYAVMDGTIEENIIWSIHKGNIVKYDVITKLAEIIFLSDENKPDSMFFARKVFVVGKHIIFVGNKNIDIYIYSKENPTILEKHICNEKNDINIKNVFLVDDKIIIFAMDLVNGIWIYDVTREEVINKTCVNEIIKELKISDLTLYNNEIYIAFTNGQIYKYIVYTNVFESSNLKYEIEEPRIRVSDSFFYLREKNGYALAVIDRASGVCTKYKAESINEQEASENKAGMVLLTNGNIVLLPMYTNTFMIWDSNKKTLEKIAGEDGDMQFNNLLKRTFSICGIEYKNHLIMLPWGSSQIWDLNLTDNKAKMYSMILDKEKCKVNYNHYIEKQKLFFELDNYGIKDFIKLLL